MKLNMEELKQNRSGKKAVKVGNLYRAGAHGKTRFWLLVSVDDHSGKGCLLGIDDAGQIVGVQTVYNASNLKERQLVGFCAGVETMTFTVSAVTS